MRVLVADRFENVGLDGLQRLGVEVLYEPTLAGDALAARVRDSMAQALIVRSTEVTDAVMRDSKLGLIVRAGAGYNTIDIDAASQYGILVTNCPGRNSQAVAELAFGLIVACDRRIPDNVTEFRAGNWNKSEYSNARGLHGRTLGLLGIGKIAQEMVVRARAFGMNVVAFSRWMTPDLAAGLQIGRAANPLEVALMSDVISVHVALTPDTRGMLDSRFFESMRPNSIFVNTSRAEVVNQTALLRAVRERGIRAGLDVFEGEPVGGTGTYEGELRDEPNVYVTHHIGASTDQAQEAIATEVVHLIREYRSKGTVPNVVNIKRAEIATHVVVVRHLDRVGVLAHVLGVLKDEGINVQEMENIVLGGARSAIAQISVDQAPAADALLRIKLNENVFDASVFELDRTV
ncbi:MAG: phosphoglycerate dehydrogenase [Fimbriimonadaceae bacterium]|nr:phosphoglycerate dehydrogenase [Fimbriimonadaceae bacterium]